MKKRVSLISPIYIVLVTIALSALLLTTIVSASEESKTPSFEITFEKTSYTFVDPFVRSIPILAKVKNTGNEKDEIRFFFEMKDKKSNNQYTPGGSINLDPGETRTIKISNIVWGMRDNNNKFKLNLKIYIIPILSIHYHMQQLS